MATIYVGPTSAGAADGTSWANRYGTLNASEDRPVQAGDTVMVGPGTYRETLTCDVSGSSGSPITYIGDYSGANTDGVGGVVRITGSDNDQAAARANGITASAKHYRTFRGFALDTTTGATLNGTNSTDWIVDQIYFGTAQGVSVDCNGASQARWTVRNCYFPCTRLATSLYFNHSSGVNDTGHVVENCLFPSGYIAVYFLRVGGGVVRNSLVYAQGQYGILTNALTAGQFITVNNCVITGCGSGLYAVSAGEIIEDYNTLYANETARTNVSIGVNSVAYPPLFDTRWFFEAVNGGSMVTPFDLASYSQLVNVAGTSPTTTDLRGTSVIGAQREWGALEYDPALLIEAGSGGGGAVSISPFRGNF